jgi:hypothetical protein
VTVSPGAVLRRRLRARLVAFTESLVDGLDAVTRPAVFALGAHVRPDGLARAIELILAAAALAAMLSLPFGTASALRAAVSVLVTYLAYAGVALLAGRALGARARAGEVAYLFALFVAPLSLLTRLVTLGLALTVVGLALVPLLLLALAGASTYFGLLAIRAGMRFDDRRKVWITLSLAQLAALAGHLLPTLA